MKTIKLIGLFLCLVSVLCAGSFTLKLGVPINAATLSQLRKTELVRLNAYRKAHGVGAVSSSEKL